MTRLRPRSVATVLALTALPAVVLPAAAGAAASGSTTIELKGAAASALSAQKVRISAQKPARANASRIVLPVAGGTVATGATLRHGGSVTFRSTVGGRARTAKLTAWQTRIGARQVTISAKLAGKRVALFTLTAPKRDISLDAANRTATVDGGRARLTSAGAKALRTRLALRRLPAAALGAVKVAAKLGPGTNRQTGNGNVPTPTPTNPSNPSNPGTPTTPSPTNPTPRQCQGFSVGNVPTASAPLDRAAFASAASVTTASVRWYPRATWIRYINSGTRAGDGVTATDGATAGPEEVQPGASFRLIYSYNFTPNTAASWYDATANAGVLAFTGTVRFAWEDHGIDITMKNPEVELNGSRSRVVFAVAGASCSTLPSKRVELLSIPGSAPTGAAPFVVPTLPATLTPAGAIAFSDMYIAGDEWGSIQGLTFTTG
ncbi:MAG TPA: HtaA domain-containing protein [Conexibacter sp.]|nr:HtaA domain-containing protein [Conexibacter sp.]